MKGPLSCDRFAAALMRPLTVAAAHAKNALSATQTVLPLPGA